MEVELKQIESKVAGKIVYCIEGRNTYFSCVTSARSIPSSIQAAEQIVLEICAAEEHCWQMLFFLDVQTHRGYASCKKGAYKIDQLDLRSVDCEPVIEQRVLVTQGAIATALAAHGTTTSREAGEQKPGNVPGVPEHILQLFLPYIVE